VWWSNKQKISTTGETNLPDEQGFLLERKKWNHHIARAIVSQSDIAFKRKSSSCKDNDQSVKDRPHD